MKLEYLFDHIPEIWADIEVTGIHADSRSIRPGYIFAALQGLKANGEDFISSAIKNGASAILSAKSCANTSVPEGFAHIKVAEPRLTLAQVAARFYPEQPAYIVGITGTNGKSSTVDFVRQIWTMTGHVSASMGTLGAIGPQGVIDLGHTTPDPVAIHHTLSVLARQNVSHLAMEASSHGLAQYRLDAVKLGAVAFTNFTQDHLDYHADLDAYRAAKLRLFSELVPKNAPAIISADDPFHNHFEQAAKDAGLKIFTVGWRAQELKIVELTPRITGQSMHLKYQGQDVKVELPLIGEFQALNALMAAGICLGFDDDPQAVFAALGQLKPVKGRMELVGQTPKGAAIYVDYAHTPDGLDMLLRAARPHTPGKISCIFGCGGDRDPYKRKIMGEIGQKLADKLIITDDNPRNESAAHIRRAIREGAPDAIEIADRADAIATAMRTLEGGDSLLIAGKGHETGQIIGDQIIPFSDQDTVLVNLEQMENAL